jgi:fructan beta-fructosidase
MAVYDESPNIPRNIAFYTSQNLRDWTFASRINDFFECPDLFELPLEGNPEQKRWVLYGADGRYLLGDFDGKEFHPQSDKQQVWFGNFYAAQTYSDAPDGRRVQIGWGSGIAFPGMPFNQQMTIPVELSLRKTSNGLAMFAWPVKETSNLVDKDLKLAVPDNAPLKIASGKPITLTGADAALDLFDFSVEIQPKQSEKVTLTVQGTPIVYDAKQHQLICRHVHAALPKLDGRIQLRIIGDRNSLEIFVNEGQVAISAGGLPSETDRAIRCSVEGADIVLDKIQLKALKSAWKK